MILMMSENIVRNMYSSKGIKNYPTQLHLVGHYRKLKKKAFSTIGQKWTRTFNVY
jgi:hypothetical protein